jgi:hypothetical protein
MMKRIVCPIVVLLLGLVVASPALAQTRNRDPLSDAEVDQMREAADFPDKRLTLMIRFAKERIAMIGLLRTDPPSATRPKQIHDYLQDFISILDETDDNIDMYGSHHSDMRKGLKLLIEADSEWQLNLRQLKEQSPADELQQYSSVLANAIDAVGESAKTARETLEEQNKLAAEKKLNKVYTERKD